MARSTLSMLPPATRGSSTELLDCSTLSARPSARSGSSGSSASAAPGAALRSSHSAAARRAAQHAGCAAPSCTTQRVPSPGSRTPIGSGVRPGEPPSGAGPGPGGAVAPVGAGSAGSSTSGTCTTRSTSSPTSRRRCSSTRTPARAPPGEPEPAAPGTSSANDSQGTCRTVTPLTGYQRRAGSQASRSAVSSAEGGSVRRTVTRASSVRSPSWHHARAAPAARSGVGGGGHTVPVAHGLEEGCPWTVRTGPSR